MDAAKQRAGLEWVILVAMYCLTIVPDAPRRAERYLANKEYKSGLALQPTVQRISLAESLVLGKSPDTFSSTLDPKRNSSAGTSPVQSLLMALSTKESRLADTPTSLFTARVRGACRHRRWRAESWRSIRFRSLSIAPGSANGRQPE